jgi:Protein of unknown function (DUF2474)
MKEQPESSLPRRLAWCVLLYSCGVIAVALVAGFFHLLIVAASR